VLHPSVHAVTAVALAGACVAGYFSNVRSASSFELTGATVSAEHLREIGAGIDVTTEAAEHAESSRQATLRVVAIGAAAKAAAAEAARLAAERQAAAERAARDAQREALVANARSDPRSAARALLADHGWSDSQFSCLDRLWQKESNWSYTARNRSSGAYGIPQSLPGSKMGTVAADWRTNPITQIKWGLGYIQDRYGSPCSAWSHSQARNWY
jgi:hypothetical protein